MSFGVAYYIRYLIILVVQRKVARTLEQNRALNFQDSVYYDSCVFWSLASKHRIFFCLHLVWSNHLYLRFLRLISTDAFLALYAR